MENDIVVLMRQTNYTREEAEQSLVRNQTIEKAIQEYLGIMPKDEAPTTVNQGIFRSIREFVDNFHRP